MKKLGFLFFAGIIALSGCRDTVTETITYFINEPILMSEIEFRSSLKTGAEPRAISNYGKMCFYEGYIYISESGTGIHIINNSDPTNPQNIAFIELLGNADLAIRNGKLYADAYMDLVWFDINDPSDPKYVGRLENVFVHYGYDPMPETGNNFGIDYNMYRNADGSRKGVVVGWKLSHRTETITYDRGGWGWERRGGEMLFDGSTNKGGSGSSSFGITGSMSRFAQYSDYLYSVINNYMSIFNLSGAEPVKAADNIYIGWNVETIFSYKDNLFIGSPMAMIIYSVADPLKPEFMSSSMHVWGCDPVVVENDIAYVTVHADNFCGQDNNDLIIYDVSNVRKPQQIVSYAMTKPKGLAVDNGVLFVCDAGLKIFNAANPQTIMANQLAHYSGMEGYDVIAFNNLLMMIADDGLYQYDYSDVTKIFQLSKLPFEKK